MKHIGLFEGIGGFSLAARWMGWDTIAWCEWNEFGQKVLNYHFPKAKGHGDITKTDFTIYRGQCDILTGGFPCQPYSTAGKRKGKEDDRHLWPEMLRAIKEIQPSWVVGENVLGLINWSGGLVFNEVQADLEAAGYEIFPFVLPACGKNAPHKRDRVWFVAYSDSNRNNPAERGKNSFWEQQDKEQQWSGGAMQINGFGNESLTTYTNSNGQQRSDSEHEINASERGEYALNDIEQVRNVADTCGIRLEGSIQAGKHERQKQQVQEGGTISEYLHENGSGVRFQNFPTKPPICSRDDGLSYGLDNITFSKWRTESIKAYGNAIVPQVAYEIFKVIEKMTNQ